jgi:hypothetical protein
MNDNIRRQNQITGFLLGLGIGLLVGIVFQPRNGRLHAGLGREY